MPIIPTYQSNIGAPDLSGAWLGGQRIAQEAAADAARISLGYEQIAANRVENEMRLAAQKEALSRQALKAAQEQEIEKAYRETQLGLAERRLKDDEAITAMRLQEAARSFSSQREYERRVAAGEDPELVMRQVGFGQPGFSTAINTPAVREPSISVSDRAIVNKLGSNLADIQSALSDPNMVTGTRARQAAMAKALQDQIDQVMSKYQQAPASIQPPRQWQVPPESIPAGNPTTPTPSFFIGTPPIPPVGLPANLQPTQGLTIPSQIQSTNTASASTIPRPGDVVKGYRFKGGDPSVKSNWEKVR